MAEIDDHQYRSPNRRHNRQFFYKYVSGEVAKIILATRSLRWSSPLRFNDPFDITQELRLNFNEPELQAAFTEELAALIVEPDPSANPTYPDLRVMLTLFNELETPSIRQWLAEHLLRECRTPTVALVQAFTVLKQQWSDFVPTLRILCLSELNDVASMWLHYADSYQGVVLEFECLDKLDSAFLLARPIIYQDTLPAIADKRVWAHCMVGLGEKTYRDLFTEYLYIKTTAWSYEREWRIVSVMRPGESGLYSDYSFNARALTGIYLGASCSTGDQADILSFLSHDLEHVSAYRACIAGTEARFTFQNIR